jgi:hypothetical protein
VKRPDGVSCPVVVVVSVSAGAGSVVLSVVLSVVVEVVADVVVEVVGGPVRPSSTGGGDVVVGTVGFGFGLPVMGGFAVLVRSESVVGVLGEVVVPGVVGGVVVVDGVGDCVVVVAAPVGDPVTGDGVLLAVAALGSVAEPSVVDSATAMAAEAQ